jgi:CHRD domain-containing protein
MKTHVLILVGQVEANFLAGPRPLRCPIQLESKTEKLRQPHPIRPRRTQPPSHSYLKGRTSGKLEKGDAMRRRALVLIAGIAVATALAVATSAGAQGRPLSTTLTGAAEAPGPGDSDASGSAFVTLNQGQGEVCFDLTWENIDGTVTDAHIHIAPPGSPGPVVVPLFVAQSFPGTGRTSGCTGGVDKELIKAIRQDPAAYYVNIHSTVFPAGAVRGQLSK